MLSNLYIKNYAIIDEISLSFPPGLTTITGETGSGKSILLGALGLIMGNRADTDKLYRKDEKCIVEATYDISRYHLRSFFDENDFDYSDELLLRREIRSNGKSRAFINDTPALLKDLRKICQYLIQQHQQFDTLDILGSQYQLNFIDALADNVALLIDYRVKYEKRMQLIKSIKALKNKYAAARKEQDYIRFQLKEIKELELRKDEIDNIDAEYKQLQHADEIVEALSYFTGNLSEGESTVIDRLRELRNILMEIEGYLPEGKELKGRIDETILELEDISNAAYEKVENVDRDPEKLTELREKIDGLQRLIKKHQLNEYAELFLLQEELESNLSSIDSTAAIIEEKQQVVTEIEKELSKGAELLHARREKVLSELESNVEQLLASLSMSDAKFSVRISPLEKFGPQGTDKVEFLFNANKGGTLQSLRNVASGGEMSRLALVLSSLVAQTMTLPTLIFDEIDSGVSGDVSLKMGKILKTLARKHQVIVITHSPQIAAQGDVHYYVSKRVDKKRTYTEIEVIENMERIKKIAIMLSQNPPTEAAQKNAEELLNYKYS